MCLTIHCRPLLSSTRFYELGQENLNGWNGRGFAVAASLMKLLVLCWSLSHWRSGPLRKALREYGSCLIFSLGPGSALEWAKKNISASLGMGEGHCWASFARRYFSYLTPFFSSPPAPTFTTEPGPRLVIFFFVFCFLWVLCSPPSLVVIWDGQCICNRTLFVSVPRGGGVRIGCKVGVLWPPFNCTHLICGMGAIAPTLLGGGLPVCLNTKNKRHENLAALRSHTFVSFQ